MKYYVTYRVDATYTVEVEAGDREEAMEKAEQEYCDADFGVAENIEGECIVIDDEKGNRVFEV